MLDLEQQSARQVIDWNNPDIEWLGDGGDRGLRGIAFDKDTIYVAASDRLLAYTSDFRFIESWTNPHLKYAHGIFVWERTLYVTSAGYDSVLRFDLDEQKFQWAMHIQSLQHRFKPAAFDPISDDGPLLLNKLHINNVFCSAHGMYVTGLRTNGMLHFNGKDVNMAVQLPVGSRDARPFRDGVLFNDSADEVLRYTGRGEGEEDRAMAAAGFARGMCVLSDTVVAGGSSPSTVTLYNLADNAVLGSVQVSTDDRCAVHSIARWPYN